MDADGLPIVGTGIDFSKVGAIHQKRTLAFLNHFISHTVRFLNRFSGVCEEKLEAMAIRLQRLETTMSLLEAKLASVPGLENVTALASSTSAPPSTTDSQTSQSTPPSQSVQDTPAPAPSETAPDAVASEPAPPAAQESTPTITISQDPRYARYFKLLHVGVPPQAVKLKMTADGINPDLLDKPDAPAPAENQGFKQDNDESEFSSDGQANSSDDDDDSSGFSD